MAWEEERPGDCPSRVAGVTCSEVNRPSPRRCLISAGPTSEPIDAVRRLTNFSTGSLGTLLANALSMAGHEVVLMRSRAAVAPPPVFAVEVQPFSTAEELRGLFERRATTEPVWVLHAAAVGDFRCDGIHAREADGTFRALVEPKVSTGHGELWMRLSPTPKVLSLMRDWFPNGRLVGWKYEANGARADALARGREQLASNRTDACVVNGPVHGPGYTVLRPGDGDALLPDASALAGWLADWMARDGWSMAGNSPT